ncbi:NADH dehydrogenase (ubiquinone) 1 beta subcomplex 8 [Cladophialophora yegresii CBS 114405]|uniref:NADH dehydrogenase (Ubiquinone) 1 beta subcomplex 8 n=1 Tax=Cladophialophora yegresii CBS 114405 TaxID=1182544 RepID=W9X280_9EURO|nr:NADH dehydrogenase (ubiquinone) 1 beta subcomplex 8 [Cladophialophora yegresii CBS 114405]EXJ64599.1 NADH dehydrogenase (ubiquinone) 1 beta subcomplex 8 [Cladophialophora yegresii CBS 114405]
MCKGGASRCREPAGRPRNGAQTPHLRLVRADSMLTTALKNNNYINPPRIKRSKRDPYADWDDKQEMRNFGEPVHEDNDVLGVFSLHDYTFMSTARGLLLWAGFISAVLGIYYGVSATYPGKPSAPKEYEGGLFEELGGPGAVRARMAGDPVDDEQVTGDLQHKPQISRDVVLNQDRETQV